MTEIFIVAVKSEEYDDHALLPDLLRTSVDTPSFDSQDYRRTRAWGSFAKACAYLDSLGAAGTDYSIFRVESEAG